MYSVEDLLISHGYKLPQNTSTAPTAVSPTPPSSYDNKRYGDPSSCRQEILESRSGGGHGTVNGYEIDSAPGVYVYGNNNCRKPQPPAPTKSYSSSHTDNAWRDRNSQTQRREADSGNQGDTHSLGDSLTTDSGFCEGPRGVYSESRGHRDVSYWRRRGQDFSVLLDYADFREPRGGGYRSEGVQQPQRQEVPPEDQRQQRERQRWAVQSQAQSRSKQREAALQQWTTAAVERKCQSLGTDEWRPAVVSFARQLSDSEGDSWARAQEQQQLQQRHLRTPDGAVVVMGPRNKGKSQSLPRMLPPDSLQYVAMSGSVGSGQDVYRKVNGHPGSHHDPYNRYNHNQAGTGDRDRCQASLVPKTRFSRPLRPPSYEVHQQTRGSSETLSGDPAAASTPQPQARDRTPLPHPRMGDPRLDYYSQDGGSGTDPPGYIPPPSYPPKRAPLMRGGHGGHRGYGEVPVNYRYHQVFQQQQMRGTPDPWFSSRHTGGGGSWPEPQREPLRERSVPHRKQLYPGYSEQQHQPGLGPGIQYVHDPRVRQNSGGGSSSLGGGGNSMTDPDNIRHIRNSTSSELPSVTVSDHSSDDSAFLTSDPASPTTPKSTSDYDNKNNRWKQQHSDLHKETDSLDNFPAATDQNCNRYIPKNNLATASSVLLSSSSDQGFSETTITQVKKIVPGDSGVDHNNRNSKRKSHSETIFCLVSVPIHMQQQQTNKDSVSTADQNNNEKMPDNNQNTVVQSDNSQSLRSKSLSDMGLKPPSHTSSFSSMRSTRKGPLRKEIVDAWSLQASADKELCYAGSWPGDQYRNQETQTSSPVKGPGCHPASDTTTDSGVGPDCSSVSASYGVGYPMKGQKNLHPSSNSAFSRLSISPAQPLKTGATTTTSNTTTKPPDDVNANSQGQVAFGQFLLKPVSRRPWDAIEELECFNKAAGKVQPRRPSVDQCIDDLDEVYRNIMELSGEDTQHQHQPIAPPPLDSERETVSLPDQRLNNKPNNNVPTIRPRLDSWGPGSSIDPEYREVRSAFFRPQPQNRTSIPRPLREDLVPTGFRDYKLHNEQSDHRETYDPRLTYRQEQDVAKESLLRDVGLTVYTEAPGCLGEQDQHCGPTPLTSLDHEELCQNVQLLWESGEKPSLAKSSQVEVAHICEGSNKDELGPTKVVEEERKVKPDNVPVVPPRFRGHVPNLNIRRARTIAFKDGDYRYSVSSDPLSWRNEATLADRHLETLLIKEKANTRPTEDLSNLYEVKCAKGIPENETMEQRAARILGIDAVESLGLVEQKEEEQEHRDNTENQRQHKEETQEHSPDRDTETKHVRRQFERMMEVDVSVVTLGEEKGGGPSKDDSLSVYEDRHAGGGGESQSHPSMVLELPEFPPSSLPLSLPMTRDEELALSVLSVGGGGERQGKKGHGSGGASPRLSSSPSSISPGCTESMAHMDEPFSEKEEVKIKGKKDEEKEPKTKREEKTREGQEAEKDEVLEPDEKIEGQEVEKDEVVEPDEKREGQEAERSEKPDVQQEVRPEPVSRPMKPPLLPKPIPKPRSGTVAKREITLPLSFSVSSCGSSPTLEDGEMLSDSYDPSRVERV
ncbi:unnamed protein product [Oncorhynchus mykiss]|uniref:Junctional cadherin 5 associated a n=1 Tax=Oncorhynchus mykiss TaxID=8022 RepID=A0A060X284_ONCMY|nr:unnamed protein product [Oncorhynchus mykiss]